ncbi:AAA family ATPase [Streptomyces meridianus]|uniref:Nuclease SbcCD subunit C n=1 Tax=Streptomyces meridianus TaxID=2938945 RepID=A0ABT0X6P4_9ACTN|nr:SMC family ATPase [Streptomyces meridianus]MCM2577382.1 SMC family ATPase [Streptomyces meridianus]
MRLHRLEVTAFGPFAGTQRIDFDELSAAGLFLLHGPTGAGKTSVLDAVCFALYGSVPGARQSGQGLRSDHAEQSVATEVALELTVAERRLEITRRPEQSRPKKRGTGLTRDKAHTALRELRNGQWTALSRSHQEIGEEITQLLGMSKEQFCQVVLLPQGDFARFLRSDAEARGRLLGALFDTGRFSAAEDRLAELRRTAEKRVRHGDDRLLARAHRMAQAATGTASAPLPDRTPGEPGFAEELLTWACLARVDAREARDIARTAVEAAEEEHRAAQQGAEDARELARLQQRRADVLRRRAALAAGREEHERISARLERAEQAQRVLPALEFRAAAERDQQAAVAAVDRSRQRLPGELAEAGADRLEAVEHRLREELGELSAARRSEQRVAELAVELAGLDRQAHADDELLHEADAWLAGWYSSRDELRRRVEEAQEAATRAEQLGAVVEPELRRLEAAQRRDDLAAELPEAEERFQRARRSAGDAHERWLDLRERRLQGIAAELAAELGPGDACAVCGSTEHPRPARAVPGQANREAEEAALAEHRRAEGAREDADRELRSRRESLAAADSAAGGEETARIRSAVAELQRSYIRARHAAGDLHAAREAADRGEREREHRLEQRRRAEQRAAARTSRREALTAEQASLEAELSRVGAGPAGVTARAGDLERRADAVARAAVAVRAAEESAQRLKEADARLADAASRAGFENPRAAADAVLDDARWRELRSRAEARRAEQAFVEAELADPGPAEAAVLPPADPAAALTVAEAATRRLREASAVDAAARERCTELDRLSDEAVADARRLAPLREEFERLARLASLAAGTSAENERRMRLEAYVLAARLEQVAAAAGERLERMSSGRYTLVHSDARSSGRGRSGLGLRVIDAWTGTERDTATLSGGETFFVSLALALGLADVVTDEAGGVRLDTLFIDEGFGSLDEQTLDEVLDVLDALRERDRAVGIVSHVPELRQRVPARLEVAKARNGSAVRQRTVGAES